MNTDKVIKWKREGKLIDGRLSISSILITKGFIPSSRGGSSPQELPAGYGVSVTYEVLDSEDAGKVISRGQFARAMEPGKIPSIEEYLQTISEVLPKEELKDNKKNVD